MTMIRTRHQCTDAASCAQMHQQIESTTLEVPGVPLTAAYSSHQDGSPHAQALMANRLDALARGDLAGAAISARVLRQRAARQYATAQAQAEREKTHALIATVYANDPAGLLEFAQRRAFAALRARVDRANKKGQPR